MEDPFSGRYIPRQTPNFGKPAPYANTHGADHRKYSQTVLLTDDMGDFDKFLSEFMIGAKNAVNKEIERDTLGMTVRERLIQQLLAVAWNIYYGLPEKNAPDDDRFADSISECQRMIAMRYARRQLPDLFPTER